MRFSRLPPLNALRAFEAVARHLSFRKAAAELFGTPAAVTHQIKALAEQLGLPLFVRRTRRIELTEAAQSALPLLQQGFESLALAVAELRGHVQIPRLTVGATPTLVSRWLMPRLQSFLSEHPGVDVRLVASGRLITPGRSGKSPETDSSDLETDLDVLFHSGTPEGEVVDLLFRVEVMPMCHPRLLEGPNPLREPADLRHHTLLHGDGGVSDRTKSIWALWLKRAGVTGVDPRRGLQLDHSTHALDAAVDGLGVTLAMPLLAEAELAANEVVVPFRISLPLTTEYYAVTSKSALARPEVAAFRDWLLREAAKQKENPSAPP